MPYNVGNAVEVELGQNISDTDTLFDLAAGGKAALPTLNSDGDVALLTFFEDDGAGGETVEIMEILSVGSGETIQVARGQEGTTAKSWVAGTKIQIRITAGLFESAQIGIGALVFEMDNLTGGSFTTGGRMAVDAASWANVTQLRFRTSGVNMPTEVDPRGMLETIAEGDILFLARARGGAGGMVAVAGAPTDDGLRINIPLTSIVANREAPIVGSRYALQIYKVASGGGVSVAAPAALPYTISSTAQGNNSAGEMSTSSSTLGSVFTIKLDPVNGNSQNIVPILETLTPGSKLLLMKNDDPAVYGLYSVDTINTAFSDPQLSVSSLESNGSVAVDDDCTIFLFEVPPTLTADPFLYHVDSPSGDPPNAGGVSLWVGTAASSASVLSIEEIQIHDTNDEFQVINAIWDLLATGDVIMLQDPADASAYGTFTVGTVSFLGDIYTAQLTYVAGSGSFTFGDPIQVRPFKA